MDVPQDLRERDRALAAGADCVAAARAGRGGALFILGVAGLGKSAVLNEICRQAADRVPVCRARCDPMEASLAFGVLVQVVRGLGGDDTQLTAVSPQEGARDAALYRTLRWLEATATWPVVVVIDDLQWADPDSLVFLGFLGRRLERLPIAVIASLRPWPPAAGDVVWSLANGGHATIEHLLPLSEEGAAAVLAARPGGFPTDMAGRAWRMSGGNPLLLGLAAGELAIEGTTSTDTAGPAVRVDERSLVLRRFSGLSPAGTRWAQAAAVFGIEFRPELVSEVAGLDGDAAEAAAEAVWRSGLARESAAGAAVFVHPLFGQLLYDDVPAPVRAGLHARAFTALTARGMDDVAAEHAMRANLVGDPRAIRVLSVTGRRALRSGAPTSAANRLEAAVRLGGETTSPALLTELTQALLEAGRPAEAASTIRQVIEMGIPLAERVSALTMLSRAYFSVGDFDSAAATMETAAAHAEPECPEALVLPILSHANAVLMTAGPGAALPMIVRAKELARGASKGVQAQANAKWGMVAFWCGDPAGLGPGQAEGGQLLDAAPADVVADLRSGFSGVLLPYACTAMAAERFEEAEAAFRRGMEEAERVGAVTAVSSLGVPCGLMLLRTRVRDSLPIADRLLSLADLVPLAEPLARTIRSYALLELGDEQGSADEGHRASATAPASLTWVSRLWLDHVDGLRLLRAGRFKDASAVYREIEQRYGELGIGEPCIVPFARHAATAHARAGKVDDAERVVHWLEERADQLPCRWPAAAAAAGKAALALRRRASDEADKHYRTAIAYLDDASLPLEHAEVLIDHGSMLRRDGRPREARESLRRAGEVAESVGAAWLARRAGEELAAAGGRRRNKRGAHELTPQERRIARLAATGASDKDIAAHLSVSVRTVRTHLEHIYAKVGIHSRRELFAMGEALDVGRMRPASPSPAAPPGTSGL